MLSYASDLALRRFGYAEGELRLSAVRDLLSADDRARARAELIDLQYDEVTTGLSARAGGMTPEDYRRAHQEVALRFWQAGRIPRAWRGASMLRSVLGHAERARDAELFSAALAALRERVGEDPNYAARITDYERTLEELHGR